MKDTARLPALSPDLIERFRAIVGANHALTDPDQQLPYLREWRDMYEGRASIVLRPGSTEEVSKIMALAHEHSIPVVPQAGNTGLVGGQMAMNGEIVLSVGRLKNVRAVDAQGFTMTVETGLTLAEAQAAADNVNRLFPLSLPSEGTCQIGGNLGTNAGGVGVLAYGNTRQLVLGLEVVLADGRIWKGLNALKKDNTGYDLKDLFIGSEGTLGIITAAVLKLFPKPAEKATAILALPELANAISLIGTAQETAGQGLTAFEFLPRTVLEMVLRNVRNTRDPFSEVHPWYVLMEISGSKPDGTADRLLTEILEAGSEKGLITDARLAASLAQANDFWRLREGVSEAQKPEGGNIKNDVSVPIAKIPEFIARASAAVLRVCPGARPLPLGHFGDGNVHYNIAQPIGMPKPEFMAHWDGIVDAVHEAVLHFGGSISAEHGIGQMKRKELAKAKGDVAMDLMRSIKAALDPKGILNPGKVL
jgi:FAD/FMN-containing dehydrogenase